MSTTQTVYEHISFREDGNPIITGTTMKVVELVAERLAWGWSPEELHLNHPYLSLGQIHSALAYYWDHEEEMNKEIESSQRRFTEMRDKQMDSPLMKRLKAMRQP